MGGLNFNPKPRGLGNQNQAARSAHAEDHAAGRSWLLGPSLRDVEQGEYGTVLGIVENQMDKNMENDMETGIQM